MIDEGEVGAVATIAKGGEEPGDFFAGEDVGERFLTFDLNLRPDLPFEAEVIAVEGSQSANGLIDGGSFKVSLGLQVEEKVENWTAP